MTQRSRLWDGSTVGDATEAPYDAATEFSRIFMSIAGAAGVATNLSAVFRNELNQLNATGIATPVTVATGRALTWGAWYENDAPVAVVIPTPAVGTRIDRIVLRKDWLNQTVRITRVVGVEGGAEPALTQAEGTTWDEPLWRVTITTGGVITLVDQREFVGGRLPNSWAAGSLIYADTTTSLSSVPAGAANTILTSTGASTAPAWQSTAILTSVTLNTTGLILNSGAFINFASQSTAVIRAGTTSLTVQNSVGTTNLTIAEAGSVTIRNGLTIQASGASITGAVTLIAAGQLIGTSGATTGSQYIALTNSGGTSYFGMDSSAGTVLFNGAAYAVGISAPSVLILRISGAAANVITITTTTVTVSFATTFSAAVSVTGGITAATGNISTTVGAVQSATNFLTTGNNGYISFRNAGAESWRIGDGVATSAGVLAFWNTAGLRATMQASGELDILAGGLIVGTATGTSNDGTIIAAATAATLKGIQLRDVSTMVAQFVVNGGNTTFDYAGTMTFRSSTAAFAGRFSVASSGTITMSSGDLILSTGSITLSVGAISMPTGTVGAIPINIAADNLGVHHIRLGGYTGLQATTASAQMWMFSNAYWTGTVYKYITTFSAASIFFTGGTILLQVAVSGTAGTNITWATAMTILNTARVQINTLGAFVAGDKYVICDANGELHKSALGPAS